jgi:hypothetical protein
MLPLQVTSIVDVGPAVQGMQAALPVVLGIAALFMLVSIAGAVIWVLTRAMTK